ncbi:MAG: LacI family DNA-binding transcriptional regulator [Lactobacillus sp.]|jgi:DNA-binding LacI/PurR family transcriptional regulator|uniref:LacI family DNA-binding transcriptional regulator n=1 Tax=Lacticaseibacillus suilingensis TaxID=2799577 RepID=A0ABW4BE58_9LACO|nr:LacI family DNA-binding transcriptional regulator [Lacticaseibacillus suilingensis]MCI1893466.1 LacI family DNA-binding transcriptional regulator [Lactobacillus sp.]MCI1917068.1 LacI family DNA-binding transcriptional regulator [Lactobacillus sp.]MCI1941027.1 LacI family DNA-binding transcriptional regulator [Lactobacillus sp.]MCI1971500.1 LacI family DNA-binding transcriptional regulator [Lactobacillus sp.]MCI2015997.1 LacI family DNA-binding transcriptional regulator [Lactobacillus sp.]
MTTIRDISKLTGYSIATISRYLNQSGYVSQTAREKISQVIKATHYSPNVIARDLSTGKTNTIGVVLPHAKHPYFTQLLQGILAGAFASDYRVTLLPSEYDPSMEEAYLELLRRKLFDGLIFTSHGIALTKLASYLEYGPIVICEDPGAIAIPAVFSHRESGYAEAFTWLHQQHIQHIAFLFSRPVAQSATSAVTMRVFEQIYATKPDPNAVITDVTTYADGYRAAATLVQRQLPLEYIFTNGDDVAAGVRQYYLDHHLTMPPLIGQENQLSGFLLDMPTIDHHFSSIGQSAFSLVTSAPKPKTRIAIPSHFLVNRVEFSS